MQPRQQLPRAEGFRDVVIRPKLEQENLVGNVALCAQYNHGQCRRLLLDLAADFAARHFRQAEIQDHGRRCGRAEGLQTGLPIGFDFDCEFFGLEQAFQRPLDSRIVFDNENLFHN